MFYRALVHEVSANGNTCVVKFVDYGNHEEVLCSDVQTVSLAQWAENASVCGKTHSVEPQGAQGRQLVDATGWYRVRWKGLLVFKAPPHRTTICSSSCVAPPKPFGLPWKGQVKTKAKINSKRYIQRQLLKSHDISRYRASREKKKKHNRTSPTSEWQKTYSSIASAYSTTDFPEIPLTNGYPDDVRVSSRNNQSMTLWPLSALGTRNMLGASTVTRCQLAVRYSMARHPSTCRQRTTHRIWSPSGCGDSDQFLCGQLLFCSEVASVDAASFAAVDPVFPSENCDQIVPFIEDELHRYVCAESDAPEPQTGADDSGSVSSPPCTHEPRDCVYASFGDYASSVELSSNDKSRDPTCSYVSHFLPLINMT
ncbi:hypothetical protein HPB51_016973 [Rhipicephalus microplus]|uniref:Tudor domain-containing protein n=1 Tax=Rhipicephalus microplus TaxID=6941 RepID=A0A9J6F616_RHIMP|nr:hypothetical protein HPB51_016973 [Rhipicephalus microplus]